MQSNETREPPAGAVEPVLSMRDLTEILLRHYGIHEGRYDLLVEFQIGTGPIGSDPANKIPGAVIGISKVGLRVSSESNLNSVDAAMVNPQSKPPKRTKAAAAKQD